MVPTYNRPLQYNMPYQWTHVAQPHEHQWVLKRNCSLSPSQLASCFAILGAVSLGIAGVFASRGAWMVVPFACIEVAALVAAFIVYGRHAADFERISFGAERVVVERSNGARVERAEISPTWLRVEYDGSRRALIRLVAGREALSIGCYVPDESRERLAQELRAGLTGVRRGGGLGK